MTTAGESRLPGLDVARGVALVGMVLAHYAVSVRRSDPGWLQAVDDVADGRAAPLFCVLLGVGAGILGGRGTAPLVRRGLVLLALGLAVWPPVERVFLILPHYGVLLALAAGARRLPTRVLLPLAVAAWAVPSIGVALVDGHGLRGAGQPETYGELADVGSVAWQLLWSGGYPLVGWVGFALTGLWLGRRVLADPRAQRRVLAAGVAVAALQPAFAAAHAALDDDRPPTAAQGLATFVDGTAHSNQFAWYVLAAASASAVVAACLLLAPRLRAARPLALVGRFALTAYLAHLWFGAVVVWPWRDRTRPALVAQLAVTAGVVTVLAAAAWLWFRWFRRGPVEAVVRFVAR